MALCDICEDANATSTTYECNYCGGRYCSTHRFPENHECVGLPENSPDVEEFETVDTTASGDDGLGTLLLGLLLLPLFAASHLIPTTRRQLVVALVLAVIIAGGVWQFGLL